LGLGGMFSKITQKQKNWALVWTKNSTKYQRVEINVYYNDNTQIIKFGLKLENLSAQTNQSKISKNWREKKKIISFSDKKKWVLKISS